MRDTLRGAPANPSAAILGAAAAAAALPVPPRPVLVLGGAGGRPRKAAAEGVRSARGAPVAWLRRALRAALPRHEADCAAGLETEGVRAVGERSSALPIGKETHGPNAAVDVELRATPAAVLAAELDALAADGRRARRVGRMAVAAPAAVSPRPG